MTSKRRPYFNRAAYYKLFAGPEDMGPLERRIEDELDHQELLAQIEAELRSPGFADRVRVLG